MMRLEYVLIEARRRRSLACRGQAGAGNPIGSRVPGLVEV